VAKEPKPNPPIICKLARQSRNNLLIINIFALYYFKIKKSLSAEHPKSNAGATSGQ
jgi:hypothetical protein